MTHPSRVPPLLPCPWCGGLGHDDALPTVADNDGCSVCGGAAHLTREEWDAARERLRAAFALRSPGASAITKERVDDGVRLWLADGVPVAVEYDGVQRTDKAGQKYWWGPDRDEIAERVRLMTGFYVVAEPLSWSDDLGQGVLRVTCYGRIVDGSMKWREAMTSSGITVRLDGVGCAADRRRGGDRSPFPSGVISSCIPQIAVEDAMFGDVRVPIGSGLWDTHSGKIGVQFPTPPDPAQLLVLAELSRGGDDASP